MFYVPEWLRTGKHADLPTAIARLEAFIEAGYALYDAWNPKLDVKTYPRGLPSFDEFLLALRYWLDDVNGLADVDDEEGAPLDFEDPAQVRTWLDDLRTQIEDAVAAGEDATRPTRLRALGAMTARQHLLDAQHALRCLMEAAEQGMKPGRLG